MRLAGIEPAVLDIFDARGVVSALARAKPAIVIHQLTDLPPGLDPARMKDALPRNARIRDEGTRNLIAGAVAAGAERLIAQSVCFAYAKGSPPHSEDDPLDVEAPGGAGLTARGIASLERQTLAAPLHSIVLRYGRLHGPGSGVDAPPGAGALHVDAAAHAAFLAVTRGAPGVYNIAEDGGSVTCEKAKRLLGWSADWRPG